jgi:thiamine kinase-like enzyme
MAITIEQVVERIEDWKGKAVSVQPLSGGLTNTNYRVEVEGTPYVVRLPGASTELLAIDRGNEYHNTQAAGVSGAGPSIAYYLPEENVMVLDFIYGETMSIAALNAAGMPTRIAQSLKVLHTLSPRFRDDFNMFRLTEYYLKIAAERGIKIPEGYPEYLPGVARIEAAMLRSPLPVVPCHNDLLAENYIDDGSMLRLIDFEYSGNNDPTFELGNTCQEQQYSEAQINEMCAAYFGEAYPDKLARMKLNMIMSDVGWTLWAAIQASISTIEFDFWGWAVERWGRATTKMDSPDFATWLATV